MSHLCLCTDRLLTWRTSSVSVIHIDSGRGNVPSAFLPLSRSNRLRIYGSALSTVPMNGPPSILLGASTRVISDPSPSSKLPRSTPNMPEFCSSGPSFASSNSFRFRLAASASRTSVKVSENSSSCPCVSEFHVPSSRPGQKSSTSIRRSACTTGFPSPVPSPDSNRCGYSICCSPRRRGVMLANR